MVSRRQGVIDMVPVRYRGGGVNGIEETGCDRYGTGEGRVRGIDMLLIRWMGLLWYHRRDTRRLFWYLIQKVGLLW